MVKPPLLKGVEKKILKLFKKLKVEPIEKEDILEKINQGLRRFYTAVCKDEKGRNFFLKVRVLRIRRVVKQLNNEIKIYQFLNKIAKKISLNFLFPSILKKGKFQGLNFYLRDFIEGELAGQVREDFGYKKFFLKKLTPKEMNMAIFSFQRIPKSYTKKLKLHKHGGWWYYQHFLQLKKNFLNFFLKSPFNQKILTKKEVEKTEKILKKNKKFLDEMANFPTHGDLYPNNIVITRDKKILLLDWELFHFNNYYFDPCFVWLLSYKEKKWQKKFFNLMMKNHRNSEKLFQLVLIFLTTHFAAACWQALRKMKKIYPTPVLIKSREFNLLKYYLKLFKKAIKNF